MPTVIARLLSVLLPLLPSVASQDTNTDPEPQLTCNFCYYYLVRISAECKESLEGSSTSNNDFLRPDSVGKSLDLP